MVPTYQEAGNIARLLEGIASAVPSADVLVVDDSSPDGTAALAKEAGDRTPSVSVLVRPTKSGLASAYLEGFRWGLERGYDVLVEMDADLSHRPEDLPSVLDGTSRYDVTVGSRYIDGGRIENWSRARETLSRAANAYARLALSVHVRDMTSGFRAFRREVLTALLEQGVASEGYAFQIELVYRAAASGFSVGEVPITFRERERGTSKLSRRIVFEALLRVAGWSIAHARESRLRRRSSATSTTPSA